MMNETLYLVRQALTSSTTGVNAQIAALEVLDGHNRPADIKAIYIPSEHAQAFTTEKPAQLPCIVVTVRDALDISSFSFNARGGDVAIPVEVVHLSANTGDKALAFRSAQYVQRAINRALRAFFVSSDPAVKSVNGLTVRGAESVTVEGFEWEQQNVFVLQTSIPIQVRDSA